MKMLREEKSNETFGCGFNKRKYAGDAVRCKELGLDFNIHCMGPERIKRYLKRRRKMERNNKDIWFSAMKYGVGWGLPIAWQGWVVFVSYFALLFLGAFFLVKSPFMIIPFVIYVFILSGILLYICFKKGERPDVRMGKKL